MPADRLFDVLVVGGGPAGMAAACRAAECGRRVGLVDDNPAAGGQIWRGAAAHPASRQAAGWLERLRRSPVEVLAETCVIDQPGRGLLLAESPSGAIAIHCDKVVLATGARERFLPFPGWTLPNVMGAGGLQALVKGGLPVAGRRVVVAGSGPLLLAVAAFLHRQGALISTIAEQAPLNRLMRFALALRLEPRKLLEAVKLKWELRGARYRTGCWPVSAEGSPRLEAVALRSGPETWREPCDYLACGFGLVPNLELALLMGADVRDGFVAVDEFQQTSVAGVWCAGEPTGIGGVDAALAEGEIAGYAAAGEIQRARALFAARRRALRFRAALERAFAPREELKDLATPETVVCRCEDVPLGLVRTEHSWRSAKLHTRCGMGPCQGRVCGPALEFLLGWHPDSVRPPIFPARLDHLAESGSVDDA